MAMSEARSLPDALEQKNIARATATVRNVLLFEVVGGIAVAALTYLLQLLNVQVPGWSFSGNDSLVGHFAGVPAILATGWVVLALRHTFEKRWLVGAVLANVAAGVAALLTVLITVSGILPQAAWVLGSVEALVVGLWLADMFGHLKGQGVLAALGLSAWLVIMVLLFLQPMLPYVFPALVAILISAPSLAAAVAGSLGRRNERVTLMWLMAGIIGVPVVLGVVLWTAWAVMPQ